MNKATFYSYAFGCRVNEAEKEEIDRQMKAAGMQFSSDDPTVYIINTCSVTHKAEREARQLIYSVKKSHPDTKIVVTGCAATYWQKHGLYRDLPVEMTVDNLNKEFLVELIKKRVFNEAKSRPVMDKQVTNKFMGSGRIMVKIQDGCQRFCTFCIVPYLRGMPKSYKADDIVSSIKKQTKEGQVSEVVLTAINTQAYGFDTKQKFTDLVSQVLNKTNIARISFGSIHPWSVDEDFFAFYERVIPQKRLVNFFHIPLQSGSNKMLTLMKRGYKKEEFVDKLNRIAKINPHAFLATDVIVGFLEETDADFQETYDFLNESPISKFHVFRFSRRTKTQADYMAKRLTEPSPAKKIERSDALIELGKKKYAKFLESQVGRFSTVLLLEKNEDGYREGLLDNQLPIFVESAGTEPGTIKNAEIIGFKKGRLFGKIV